ncbi:MAG TPA: outer membrane lipid asymmetry maintenance protein MlaD [Burkholderiales bacterium]|jgi:phospholipid/cholesterol/gamma-HCH transport system substrate-binding protein|nr:outer membrane lipid asymmetry maintenance protein MlaD [Burkholderiales bacterium]
MKRTTLDLWVGIFVTAGVAALFILALKVGNASSVSVSDGYRVIAEFDNIGGLKVRAPVKSAGVVVGRVEGIALDTRSFRANVTLRIDKHFPFPKDSSASILTAGLLGEQYVGMDGGGDEQNLADGDRIKITQSAIVLEKVIGQFLYGKAAENNAASDRK